jgi:hypothetical protein
MCKHQIEQLKWKICDFDENYNGETDKVVKWDICLIYLAQLSIIGFQMIEQGKIKTITGIILY